MSRPFFSWSNKRLFHLKNSNKAIHNHHINNNNTLKLFQTQHNNFSTSPYPFRPGYGLGSWIPPAVIEGMEKEGHCRAKIMILEQILTDLESTSREIALEMGALQNDESSAQTIPIPEGLNDYMQKLTDSRTKIWGKKIAALSELFELQQKLGDDDNPQLSVQTFNAGASSPVKWANCEPVFKERAFDSINVNAHFFNFDKSTQDAKAFSQDVSTAAKVQVSAPLGSKVGAQVAANVKENISKTAEGRTIESTLLLVATATHSKVLQFGNLEVDEILLRDAWNFYHGGLGVGSGGGGDERLRLEIASLSATDLMPGKNPEKISMVNECFMGSAFVGMVHFLKKESTTAEMSASSANALAQVKASALFGAFVADTSVGSTTAKKASNMVSSGQFDVKFNMLVLGYCPPIASNKLENTIKQFANFDPANFKIDTNDDASNGDSDTEQGQQTANSLRQAARQSNMKAVISATVEAVEAKSGMSVLDMETFMNAFNDYCANAPQKDGVGIPIGFNVRSWERHNIAQILWKKYVVGGLVPGMAETGGAGGAEAGGAAAE
jgi:hypothetical protein